MEPASTIISICGGFKAVAEMVGRDETRVRRWTYPKKRGGSGGLIPSKCQKMIMDAARQRGLPITPEHFFPVAESAGSDAPKVSATEDAA